MTARTVMKLSLEEYQGHQVSAHTQSTPVISASRSIGVSLSWQTKKQTKKRSSSQLTGSEDCLRSQKHRKLTTPARDWSRTSSPAEDSDVGNEIVVAPRRALPKPRNSRVVLDDSDNEEEIIKCPPRAIPKPRNRRVVLDSDDDEEKIITPRPRALLKPQNGRVVLDSDDEEEEAVQHLQPSPLAAQTKRQDSVMEPRKRATAPDDAAPESEGALLAEAEVKSVAHFGKKGQQRPTTLIARLRVCVDPSTSCRLEYEAAFHLDYASTDSGFVQVANIHAWRILKQEDWQGELLNLKLKTVDAEDDRFECARLLQTLYKSPSALRKGASDHLNLTDPKADLMHVGIVNVEDGFKRQGLLSPVLRSFRQLLNLPALLPAFQHTGAVLLCPGKFNDEKGDCWNGMSDQEVTEVLTKVYAKADGYGMVMYDGILPKLKYVTTILGRMAEDN